MDLELADKVVLVTGASGVLGSAAARALAAEQAILALCARDPARLAPLAAELRAAGAPRVECYACDLTSAESTDAAVATAIAALGHIDVLVAAAGAAQGGVFWEIDDVAWKANLELKLFGTIRALRAVAPHMVQRRSGRIVLVVGNSAKQPEPRMLPGAAANAALLAIVRGLAEELGPHGVAINALNPGPVRSARWELMMHDAAQRAAVSAAEAEAPFLAKAALRRLAAADEIGAHVAFLASPRAAHLTGTAVTVDGGSTKSI
jgi:NAD(P)-dependent dehydrogenase (short-subunit alcohol dehydrogenase family)